MITLIAVAGCLLLPAAFARWIRRADWAARRQQRAAAEENADTEYRIREWRSLPTPDADRIGPLIRRRQRVRI